MAASKDKNRKVGASENRPADQLASDISGAMGFMDKLFARVAGFGRRFISGISSRTKKVPSFVGEKITVSEGEKPRTLGKLLGGRVLRKIGRVVGIVLVFFVVIVVAFQVLRIVRQREAGVGDGVVVTPTGQPFQPYKPSVYAEDELVLEMEEDLLILDREMSTTSLKEEILNPPVLDFDINFEK